MGGGPKYPNQQLRSVSFETFFSGTLGAFGAMANVQQSLRGHLPDLYVPNVQPGEPAALRPFQLRDRNHTRSLALAVNQVTYIAFGYPGFEEFIGEAMPIVSQCLTAFGVTELTRVGFRYENELAIGRDPKGTLDALGRAFPNVTPQVFRGRSCRLMDSAVEVDWADAKVSGTEGFRVQVEGAPPSEVVRVHVYASTDGVAVADLSKAAGTTHLRAVGLFESLISEDFRKFLGETGNDERTSDAE